MTEAINVIIGMILFGVVHSLTAAIGIKAIFVSIMGKRGYLGLYRLFYNTLSVVTFAPIYLYSVVNNDAIIWSVDGAGALLFQAIQVIGLLGLTISILQIDSLRFIGLRQAMTYLDGKPLPLPDEPLSAIGVYRLVRHPLYFFSLLFLWFTPTMGGGSFGLAIGATLYFTLGSLLEEQKLRKQFGQAYVIYQEEVPWMIPFLKF